MKIRDARSLPAVAQEDLRCKAVKAVMNGRTQVEVAEIFGITRQAVSKWLKAYRKGGEKALKARRRGRPKGGIASSLAGGTDCQSSDKPLPRSTEVAVLSLDTRGGGAVD